MVLHFGYIEGINRIDTPRFTTLAKQTEWMDSKEEVHIDTTFYPPHYRNKIRVSTEDIDFNTSINYLWFEYQSKRYYYFIDSIEYINEDLIEFDVTMDYIQTYMFNIRVSNSIIERKFINRLIKDRNNNRIINRNYIREDVSTKLYEKQPKHYINEDEIYVIVIKLTAIAQSFSGKGTHIYSSGDNFLSSYQYCIYVPTYYVDFVNYNGTNTPVDYNSEDTFANILEKPECVDAYYLPISLVKGLSYNKVNRTLYVTDLRFNNLTPLAYSYESVPGRTIFYWAVTSGTVYFYNVFLEFEDTNEVELFAYNDRYIDNRELYEPAVGTIFNSNNIPALCDENYSYFAIGNEYATITIPSHYYKRGTIIGNITADITNGISIINGDFTYEDNNNYGLSTSDTNIKTVDILSDSYSAYVANNRNRWSTAGLKAGLAAADAVVSIVSTATFSGVDISRVLKDKRNYTKKHHDLKVGSRRQIGRIKEDTSKTVVSEASGLISGVISPLINQKLEDENMIMAPDTPKQFGDGISILLSPLHKFFYQEYKVRDFEQCAQYYHRNGYKVLEYTDTISNIFAYFDNRYYFNIIKFSDINLHLRGVIEDEETLAGIEERLMDGIRAWNVQKAGVVLGDFTYDNCENDYLGGA